jgi:anthranilate 1,2-dioxygenase small subunit
MNAHVGRAEAAAMIESSQAHYAREIDDGDCTAWPDFFTDDCFYKITSADNHAQGLEGGLVWLEGKGMLHDRIISLLEANVYERHSYRHLLGRPYIFNADGEDVECETSFMLARITREGPTTLFATGRYIDRYRLSGNDAKIVSRTVVLDSRQVDTLLAFPL